MFDNKAMESFCKPIKKEVYESLCALIQNYKKKEFIMIEGFIGKVRLEVVY